MMPKPLFKPVLSLSAWTPLALGLTLLANLSTAVAQPGIIGRPGRILTGKVPEVRVRIAPELNSYLVANKPKISAEAFDRSYVLRNGTPAFKLADGSVRLLMPTGAQKPPGGGAPIPPDLADAKPYINAPFKLGTRRAFPFQISPLKKIPTSVDHTSIMSPIRDQGPRGTCVAQATNAALEAFVSIPDDLSEQYTYHQCLAHDGRAFDYNDGTYTQTAIDIMKAGTVLESVWPYSNSIPAAGETIPSAASEALKYKITDAQFIGDNGLKGASIKNTKYLESILNQGKNIVFGTEVAWTGAHTDDIIDVVIVNNQPAYSRGKHEMLIVGYDSTRDYFIVRNSWGTGFGHSGYAWISYDYMRTYAFDGYYIKSVSPNLIIRQTPDLNDTSKGGIKVDTGAKVDKPKPMKPKIIKPRIFSPR